MDYYADRLGDLAQNEIITPEQFADGHRRALTPEQQLMWAVLVDALHVAIRKEPMRNCQRRDQWEARAWLAAPRRPGPGLSVHDVCDALELEVDWVRARLETGTIKHIPKHMHVAGLGTQRRKMEARPVVRHRQPAWNRPLSHLSGWGATCGCRIRQRAFKCP